MTQSVLITGASRGIGLELVKKFLANGDHVYALCRRATPELSKTKAMIVENVDVKNLASLEKASKLVESPIDILINNAGIMKNEDVDSLDQEAFDSMIEQFDVNALGPMRAYSCFSRNLNRGAKVAMITSRMGSLEDNTSGGRYGYRASKAALNMFSVSLAHDLKAKEIAVGIFHPGWVQTDMTQKTGHLTAEQSAANLFERIRDLTLENSGKFYHSNSEPLPW